MMRKTRKYILSSLTRDRDDSRYQHATGTIASDAVSSGKGDTVNLCKEDFLHMSIIGQFNLGFILARCRNHNLWILDQHACDEKYNFERLCKETVIHEQTLIAPLPLDLSPSEEHCVLEHMNEFERNGFRFSYDPEKEPRHRLSLMALPLSGSGGDGKKAVQFEREDVGALCAMLGADGTSSSDGFSAGFGNGKQGGRIAGVNAVRRYAGLAAGGSYQGGGQSEGIVGSTIVRLPKAIAMFASRACRVRTTVV
jgi:DNA mismatch repair protein PMS2